MAWSGGRSSVESEPGSSGRGEDVKAIIIRRGTETEAAASLIRRAMGFNRMNISGKHSELRLARVARPGRSGMSTAAGWTLLETLVCLAIMVVLCALALPSMAKTWQSYHLSSATSSITGVIQSTRYQAIYYGCSYQLTISGTGYQISGEALSGTPPTCATTYSNVCPPTYTPIYTTGCPISFSQGDVSVATSVTLTFNANGTVSTSGTSSTSLAITPIVVGFTVPGQTAQRTITVSGVGYVTVS